MFECEVSTGEGTSAKFYLYWGVLFWEIIKHLDKEVDLITMDYRGKYSIFDPGKIQTEPITSRSNKVCLEDLVFPEQLAGDTNFNLLEATETAIRELAEAVVDARHADRPVILFTGAHAIKNGLGPLLADLVRKGIITHIAGNGATSIHDFELALIGETSEDVPEALEQGHFGMASEFALQNGAISLGYEHGLGYGESLGRMICDMKFRAAAIARLLNDQPSLAEHLKTDFRESRGKSLGNLLAVEGPVYDSRRNRDRRD